MKKGEESVSEYSDLGYSDLGSSDESSFQGNLNLNHPTRYPATASPLPIKIERDYTQYSSSTSATSSSNPSNPSTIKHEAMDTDHDIEMNVNDRVPNVRRIQLEKLSLDELLAKTMTLKPNLQWNIHNEWCRYCGARGSTSFRMDSQILLCDEHNTLWTQNKLDLSMFVVPDDIDSVRHTSECTEREYLIDILLNIDHSPYTYHYTRRLRSVRTRAHNKGSNNINIDDYLSELPPSSSGDSESSNSSYSESSESEESYYNENDIDEKIKREHHYNTVKVECTQCDLQFVSHAKYRDHMNMMHGIAQAYKCDLCPDTKDTRYSNKAGLDKHIKRDHEKIRDFKCKLCPKSFYEKSVLEQHQRVHDGKKPYKCMYCKMRFTQRNSHKQHIVAVHFKQKNYECKYCAKKFAALTTMKSHVVSVHNDVQYTRFQCDICCKRFYEKGGYLKHKDNAHRPVDPIKEAIKRGECIYPGCDKKYKSKNAANSVRSHLVSAHKDRRYAKYECRKCDKLFYDKTSYTKHISSKHNKKYKKHKKKHKKKHRSYHDK